jgi:plastocyanin
MKTKLSIVFLIAFVLAACGSKPAPTSLPPVTASAPLSGNVDVAISGYAFSPATLTIKVGTIVKWMNQDTVGHTVVADDKSFSSGNLNQGDSFSFTFNTAGTYAYHCSVHSNMKATITVVP